MHQYFGPLHDLDIASINQANRSCISYRLHDGRCRHSWTRSAIRRRS